MQLYSPTALCPPLQELANGMISYSGLDNTSYYTIGTMATYNCNQGYELVRNPHGFLIRTCLDLGDGSAALFTGQAPTCKRKHVVYAGYNKMKLLLPYSIPRLRPPLLHATKQLQVGWA